MQSFINTFDNKTDRLIGISQNINNVLARGNPELLSSTEKIIVKLGNIEKTESSIKAISKVINTSILSTQKSIERGSFLGLL